MWHHDFGCETYQTPLITCKTPLMSGKSYQFPFILGHEIKPIFTDPLLSQKRTLKALLTYDNHLRKYPKVYEAMTDVKNNDFDIYY